MQALLLPLRENLSCVVGMLVCEEGLGFVQRHSPEVQQQKRQFFSSVQNATAEAWLTRLGKMGNNDVDDLDC